MILYIHLRLQIYLIHSRFCKKLNITHISHLVIALVEVHSGIAISKNRNKSFHLTANFYYNIRFNMKNDIIL